MTHPELTLVSYELCPYVQRSVITLIEKDIEHTRKYIDLNNRPEWFLKMSPLGKVPLLIVNNEHVIFESAVICEYLNEITPGSLHSDNPIVKAIHRAWIEFGSQMLDDIGSLYNSQTASIFVNNTLVLQEKLQRLEETIITPFFSGKDFRMVDAVYATIFRYFDVMAPYLPFDIFKKYPKVSEWRSQLAKRDSVINAVKPDYPAKLLAFLRERNTHLSDLIAQRENITILRNL
jgi:glutathione S-transferase